MLKFQAPIHKMTDLREMVDEVIHHLEAFLRNTGSQLRLLCNAFRIVFNFYFTECCQLFKSPPQLTQQCKIQELPAY
jgi:hypothetical protein